MRRLDKLRLIIGFYEMRRAPPVGQELPIQCCEEPGLHFRSVAELMTFRGPGQESLLGQIDGVRFLAAE